LPVTDPTELAARLQTPGQAAEVLAALTQNSVEVAEFSVGNPSLDEVFLALTGRTSEHPVPEEARS
jgi:daunorubicin/doxorubicin transport system ATP-binding protein